MTIDEIRNTVHDEYLAFAEEYDRYALSKDQQNKTPFLDEVEEYLSLHKGKRLRPLLVLLAAKACGHIDHSHVLMATAMELLHNATLMHDDVVDESDWRRGGESIRRRWGNQVAVLCGDFYLAQVMNILQTVGNREATKLIAQVVSTMCRGELSQLYWTSKKEVTQNVYLDIIGDKTASLMGVCCELGALPPAAGSPAPSRQALHDFGYHYGLVFQMRDDLADGVTAHDIHMPSTSVASELIARQCQLATDALHSLPPNPARDAMEALLFMD